MLAKGKIINDCNGAITLNTEGKCNERLYLKDILKNNKTRNVFICFMYNRQKKSKVITINLD